MPISGTFTQTHVLRDCSRDRADLGRTWELSVLEGSVRLFDVAGLMSVKLLVAPPRRPAGLAAESPRC